MTIITAQDNYYTVHVDKSNPTIVVTEMNILAWHIVEDSSGVPQTIEPITIQGVTPTQYIAHPTGIYTDIVSGVHYDNRDWFIRVLQDKWDEEQAAMKGGV